MSLRQIEILYKKLHASARIRGRLNLDSGSRSDIFDKIMADVERLMKKMKQLPPGGEDFQKVDSEIRLLLMKEIQIIIDDYVLCRHSGTMQGWVDMYGNIEYYIRNYYMYRDGCDTDDLQVAHRYGFFDDDQLL